MYHYNSQWFFCFLSLPKTFVLMGSFCSRKVTHKPSINIAWRLNIKTLKFDTVYSIDKTWKFLKFLFLHNFTRIFYIKSIRFELLQLNQIKQSPKKANTIFSLEFVKNFRSYVKHICFAVWFTIIDHWLKNSSSHLPKKLLLFALIKSPLKIMKNVFYFLLKYLFLFLRYLNFGLDFFGSVKSDSMRKLSFQNLWRHRLGY